MALHDDIGGPSVASPLAPSLPDPSPLVPSIGETIDDEGPGKVRQFFTDPKNLATMLVLASALAQPKRGGRSNLAHALRAGTGTLAFRGGLEQQLDTQSQRAGEAASVIQGREATQETAQQRNVIAQSQVAVTSRGQDLTAAEGVLERASEEQISKDRLDALVGKEKLENDLIKLGVEGYYRAYSDYLLNGSPGSPPDPNAFVPLPEGMTIGPLNSGSDIIVPGAGTPDPLPGPPPPPAVKEEAVPFSPTIISGVPVTGDLSRGLKKSLPADRVRVVMLRVARGRYPEIYKDATDEEIFARISSVQADIKVQLDAGMPQEVAIQLKKDKFMLEHMTREQRSEVLRIARGKIPTPRATNF